MIILDTNVVSELMRPAPSEDVVDWIGQIPTFSIFTTAITQAEILYGVEILPVGRRRKNFEKAAAAVFDEDFSGRILSFDSGAAAEYAAIAAMRRKVGRPIGEADCQIAAITRQYGAILATRNEKDFEGCDLKLKNPWRR